MALDFSNARLLSYNHQHRYFSENLNFSIEKHLQVDGSIYALTNTSGVAPVWSGISGLVAGATDYDSVIINGTNLGPGRINSLNFTEGNDVRLKAYAADIVVFASGNLFNMTGPDFSGFTIPNPNLLENFSENFDFQITADNTYNYKQTVNVKYISGAGQGLDPIVSAKQLASGLFLSSPNYGFIDAAHSGFYNVQGRRTYTESYNTLTNECAFSENFTQPQNVGTYAVKYTQEVVTPLDGISTVSERGTIEGLYQPDFMGSAQSGFATQIAGAYVRASGLLSTYFPNGRTLNPTYIVLQKQVNQFTNSINYSVQYNNDPRNQPTYSWEYTQEAQRSDSCYYVIKENGKIHGITQNCTRAAQFNNAQTAWLNTIQPGLPARVSGYYAATVNLHNQLKYLSSTQRNHPHDGSIEYDYSYTDDLTFNSNSPIKRLQIEITDNLPVPADPRFAVGGVGEIVQHLGIAKEAKRNVSLKMIGKRGTDLSVYLTTGVSTLNKYIPTGSNIFIDACEYTFTPIQNNFDLRLEWVYFNPVGGFLV